LANKTNEEMTVNWKSGDASTLIYQIDVTSGKDTASNDVQTGPYTIKRIPGVNRYTIKVLSKSICGIG